jgi:hypothetical protein
MAEGCGKGNVTSDMVSRVLSIASLVVAVGAVGFLYTQQRMLGTREQLQKDFDKQLGEQSQKFADAREGLETTYQEALRKQDERLEGWNTELNDALSKFRQDANSLLADFSDAEKLASQQRQTAFDQALDKFVARQTTARAGGSHELNGPKNQLDVADQPPTIPATETPTTGPDLVDHAALKVVNTVLRPGTGNTTLIVIRNEGAQDAEIERIRFRPEAEFEATDTFDLTPDSTTPSVTTVAFDSSENTSNKPGYYGICDRRLTNKIRVPAGQSVTLRVLIDDSRYEGYGFTGKLVVDYNAGEPLLIESARVAFHTVTARP